MWSVFSDLIKVVTAVTKIEQVPVVMVAPVLYMFTAEIGKRMVRLLRRKELTGSTCCKRNLNAAKANVPIDIIFEDECCL